jgi:hypothetical protein
VESNSQIIIKIITDHPKIMAGLEKYKFLVNHYYEKYLDTALFIDTFQNGILYIFKNYETFKLIHKPIPGSLLFLLDTVVSRKQNFMVDGIFDKENYPKEGIKMLIYSVTLPISEIFAYLQGFYESLDKDIKLKLVEDHVEFYFPTYRSNRRFVDLIFLSFEEFEKQEKKARKKE